MKKLVLPLFAIFLTLGLDAQSSAKRYILIEHFTNSRCSICASRNPAFYSLIGQPQYADDIHHISIHPSFPYSNCVFYQANTTENSAWTDQYDIPGTPRVAMNGRLMPSGSQLLRQDSLVKYIDQTSPFALQVTVSGTGASRTATVTARSLGAVPAGNYNLYVAVAEKTINMTTPNNETVHHDVFRDMLTPVTGQAFAIPAQGQQTSLSFNFTISGSWNADEIYVLAFVKENNSKLVLNSGTNLDAVSVNIQELPTQALHIAPNPAASTTYAYLNADDEAKSAEVYGFDGKRHLLALEFDGNTVKVPVGGLSSGVYFLKITGKQQMYFGKLIVE